MQTVFLHKIVGKDLFIPNIILCFYNRYKKSYYDTLMSSLGDRRVVIDLILFLFLQPEIFK